MSSYYPAGVTGNEDAFGPKYEIDSQIPCEECGGDQVEQGYNYVKVLICENGHQTEIQYEESDYEPDPDVERDRMRDEESY